VALSVGAVLIDFHPIKSQFFIHFVSDLTIGEKDAQCVTHDVRVLAERYVSSLAERPEIRASEWYNCQLFYFAEENDKTKKMGSRYILSLGFVKLMPYFPEPFVGGGGVCPNFAEQVSLMRSWMNCNGPVEICIGPMDEYWVSIALVVNNAVEELLHAKDVEIARLREQLYWSPNGGQGYAETQTHFEQIKSMK